MNYKTKIYIAFLLLFAAQLIVSLFVNNFNFAYPLDDTYIHLAIAKNFGLHGVWGPTQYEFSSASSSLLYTILLSFFFSIGIGSIYIPLIINIIAVYFLILASDKLLGLFTQRNELKIIFLIMIIFFMPAIALTLTGMEHILHSLFVIYLIYYSLKTISEESNTKFIILMSLFAFLATSVRYESLFLIAGIVILFLFKRNLLNAFLLVIISLLPILIFGIISLYNHAYFLPNTLLIKGTIPNFSIESIFNLIQIVLTRIIKFPHVFSSLVLIIFSTILLKNKALFKKIIPLSIIVLIAWILHLAFAGIGWFYRYEAYLVLLSIIISITIFEELLVHPNIKIFKKSETYLSLFRNPKIVFITLLLILPYSYRLTSSLYKSSLAPKNIYQQQVQIANYVNLTGIKSIILNDIGAVSYYNDVNLIDLHGLGTNEILRTIKSNKYNTQFLKEYALKQEAEVAIIFDNVLNFSIPKQWIKIGSWKIPQNVICWKDEVFIYCLLPKNESKYRTAFKKFSKQLPKDIEVQFY